MSPAVPSTASLVRPRRAGLPVERGPAWRAGVVGVVVAHALIVLVLWLLPAPASPPSGRTPGARDFAIELNSDWFSPSTVPPAPEPIRFVEVNPAAPENAPDRTDLFGAQNQQVAQPEPADRVEGPVPEVAGEGDEMATALVSGTAQEAERPSLADELAGAFAPDEAMPDPEAAAEAEAVKQAEAIARAVNALGGGEELLASGDGAGTTVTRLPTVPDAPTEAEARPGAARGVAASGGYFAGQPAIDRNRPRERPRLPSAVVNARATPTIRNEFGTDNIGVLAYDAAWSTHGEYLQRLIDAVQTQWERLILRSSFYPVTGSLVRVVFRLDSTGAVTEIVRVDGTGGELARRLCLSAIAERAPYGSWTEDMLAVLGRDTELTFTFHYQ